MIKINLTDDYIITRVKGLKSHLLTEENYKFLCLSKDLTYFIKNLADLDYEFFISKYYIQNEPIESLIDVTLNSFISDFNIFNKSNKEQFNTILKIILLLDDLRNIDSLISFILHPSGPLETEFGKNFFHPGGSIKISVLKELISSKSLDELKSKSIILIPEFYPLINQIYKMTKSENYEIYFFNFYIRKVTLELLKYKNSERDILINIINYHISLFFVRSLFGKNGMEKNNVKKLFNQILKSEFRKYFIFKNCKNKGYSLNILIDIINSIINNFDMRIKKIILELLKEIEINKKVSNFEIILFYIFYYNLLKLRFISISAEIETANFIFSKKIEIENIVWIAFGIYQNLNPDEILSKVILL